MIVNYRVQADVIDIKSDTPKPDDIFLVDTNVWYWLTYSRASVPTYRYQQISYYPSYLSKARSAKSLLCYSGFSLAELAHLIEKDERELFNSSIRSKEYRHNYPAERANVTAQVQAAWSQVKLLAAPINSIINEQTTDAALNRFQTQLLDGYDLFILEAMHSEGIVNVITDDGDFVTVSGIRVFTANNNSITAAQNQGKLLVR